MLRDFQSQGDERLVSKSDAGGTNYDLYLSATHVILHDGIAARSLAVNLVGKKCLAVNIGGTGEVFVDGVSAGNLSGSSTITADDAPLIIGNLYSNGWNASGYIREAGVVNRKLTATEHAQLYGELEALTWPTKASTLSNANLKVDPSESGLVGGWNMRPVGGEVIDQSGNGNDGTLTGIAFNERTIIGDALVLDGSTGYIDVGNTGQTVKTVSFLVSPDTTTEDFIDLDGGTHTIEIAAGTLTATGFSSPTLYVDGAASSVLIADKWQRVVVTTATGFTASDLDIGKETIFLQGKISNVKMYSDEKSAAWVTAQHDSDRLALWKTDWGVNESPANVTSGFLENSSFQVDSGTYKITTGTAGGESIKKITCIGTGSVHVPNYYSGQTATEAAYGTWEGRFSRAAASGSTVISIIQSVRGLYTDSANDGYVIYHQASGNTLILARVDNGALTTLDSLASVAVGEYEYRITRANDGLFKVYLKGGVYSDYTEVLSATDTTYTASNVMSFSLVTNDWVSYSGITGNHSVIKRLTI
jgi:hypothetical protein